MNASNWTIIAIAFLIGGGIFLALHSLRGRLPRARDVEDTHKPPHRYDAALQALNVLGIDPDARDDDGGTPMHRAAGEGRVEIIELLYAAGATQTHGTIAGELLFTELPLTEKSRRSKPW